MCDACPEFPWWFVAVLVGLVVGPFAIGAALPVVAGMMRRRIGPGFVFAAAALVPAVLYFSGDSYLVPFLWFPQFAYVLREFGRVPVAEITSLVIGAVGAASILTGHPPAVVQPNLTADGSR